jgi:hypothetical protein
MYGARIDNHVSMVGSHCESVYNRGGSVDTGSVMIDNHRVKDDCHVQVSIVTVQGSLSNHPFNLQYFLCIL